MWDHDISFKFELNKIISLIYVGPLKSESTYVRPWHQFQVWTQQNYFSNLYWFIVKGLGMLYIYNYIFIKNLIISWLLLYKK